MLYLTDTSLYIYIWDMLQKSGFSFISHIIICLISHVINVK